MLVKCGDDIMFFLDSYCADLYPIIKLIKLFINLVRFAVPIILILYVTIDIAKAVIAGSEDEMKKNQNVIIKRLIYALAVFLVVSLVSFTMDVIADVGVSDLGGDPLDFSTWRSCWKCKSKKECAAIDDKNTDKDEKEVDADKDKKNDVNKKTGGGCFLPGTKVITINGYKDIDKIRVGDYVLSYNEKLKKNEYKEVLNIYIHNNYEELYSISIDKNTLLTVTGLHRIYVNRNNVISYIAAEDLKIGDRVMYSDGSFHTINSISHKPIHTFVYNINVSDNHNYFVGSNGILVHNRKDIAN